MITRLLLIILMLMHGITLASKRHITIEEQCDKEHSADLVKSILPPLAALSFINYATQPSSPFSPAFLLRGVNGCVLGMLHTKDGYQYYDNERLLRTEAGIIGGVLLVSSLASAAHALDVCIVTPVQSAVATTAASLKKNAWILGLLALGSASYYAYTHGIKIPFHS